MRRRAQIITLLLAWFLASGSQWDLVQTFAWGRMFATYSRAVPLLQAVRMTFEPDNMCSVCRAVETAQQQERSPAAPGGKADTKLVLVFQPAHSIVLSAPSEPSWSPGVPRPLDAQRSSPPTPPPRAA